MKLRDFQDKLQNVSVDAWGDMSSTQKETLVEEFFGMIHEQLTDVYGMALLDSQADLDLANLIDLDTVIQSKADQMQNMLVELDRAGDALIIKELLAYFQEELVKVCLQEINNEDKVDLEIEEPVSEKSDVYVAGPTVPPSPEVLIPEMIKMWEYFGGIKKA